MLRLLGYTLALIVLAAVAFGIYTFIPKTPEIPVTINGVGTESGTEMKVVDVYETSNANRIEAHYPQVGISSVDAKIKAAVDKAIEVFKEYPANPDSSVPQNEFTSSFSSVYKGQDVVSVKLSVTEYTGGAHPNTALIAVNVDPRSGRELTLDDALAMIGKSLHEVAEQSLKELKATLGEDIIFSEGAAAKPENYGTFTVGSDRITFIFQNYQVAPYSSGQQEVRFKRVK